MIQKVPDMKKHLPGTHPRRPTFNSAISGQYLMNLKEQ